MNADPVQRSVDNRRTDGQLQPDQRNAAPAVDRDDVPVERLRDTLLRIALTACVDMAYAVIVELQRTYRALKN